MSDSGIVRCHMILGCDPKMLAPSQAYKACDITTRAMSPFGIM